MHSILFLVTAAIAAVTGADDALKPWSADTQPNDAAKSHVEEITAGQHKYTVVQGGTMDGRNCRSPMGCGMSREGALLQTWESNRSVRMENVGQSDVVNPWLSNGRNNFRNVAEIVSSAVTPDVTDAEKAFALWFQEIRQRYHAGGDNGELGNPVKVFNVYGYNTCGNDSICLASLWRQAGLKAAPARALGHCISLAFYDNAWHFYDGDLHSVYLLRDNATVAGEQDIVRDHDLLKRTHSQGILLPDTRWDQPGFCAMYFYEGAVQGQRGSKVDTTMNMVLRPEYHYQVCANRSLGALSARIKGGNQISGYFDIEQPKFALDQGPAWLKIDEATGLLSGTADAAGKVQVVVTASLDRIVRKLDEKSLVWGGEKVLSSSSERVGTATQKFVIEVQ